MQELTISRRSYFLRLFLWSWDANPNNLNICGLFWGTIFLPAVLLGRLLTTPVFSGFSLMPIVLTCYSVYLAVDKHWFDSAYLGGIGLFFAFIEHSRYKKKKLGPEVAEVVAGATSQASDRGESWFEWIVVLSLALVFDFFDTASYSKFGRRLHGPLSITRAYFRARKKRYCTNIRVV